MNFTDQQIVDLLRRILDSGGRVSEDKKSIERPVMGFWGPVWIADELGKETPWGRGKLTLEGEELLYRHSIKGRR
jgi:hypothetical protein